jgi:hypothetical protein
MGDILHFIYEQIKRILFLIPVVIVLVFLYLIVRFTLTTLGYDTSLGKLYQKYTHGELFPDPTSIGVHWKQPPTPTGESTAPFASNDNGSQYRNPWLTGTQTIGNNQVIYSNSNGDVRNILIGSTHEISSGAVITGEARNTFYVNGQFYVTLYDLNGAMLASTIGVPKTSLNNTSWSQWIARFGYIAPQTGGCMLSLRPNMYSNEKEIRIPVICR